MRLLERGGHRPLISLTPEQEEFLRSHGAAMTLNQIGVKLNVSITKARRWKIELGINDKKVFRGIPKPKPTTGQEEYSEIFDWDMVGELDFIFKTDRQVDKRRSTPIKDF